MHTVDSPGAGQERERERGREREGERERERLGNCISRRCDCGGGVDGGVGDSGFGRFVNNQ